MCMFLFGTDVHRCQFKILKQTLSEIIRAEAKSCFESIKINLFMLMINVFVHTKILKSIIRIFE